VAASTLHCIGRDQALALVDTLFGPAGKWPSPIIAYRLSEAAQEDWKEEIGHWLDTAGRAGFRDKVVERALKQARRGTRSAGIDPNDERHSDLVQELAPAMVAHYLLNTGWSSSPSTVWEPVTGGVVDVDLQLTTPSGVVANVQVKAPDQPGNVVNGRVVRTPAKGDERDASGTLRPEIKIGGEADWKILHDVDKAAEQLPKTAAQVNLIAVCPNRSALSAPHACLLSHLYGVTLGGRAGVTLPSSKLGKFWDPEWRHVAGVLMLELLRPGSGDPLYSCIALFNPVSDVRAMPDWFPHARVCVLDSYTFRWIRGEPGLPAWLPDGTLIVPWSADPLAAP
jgi:hypothetical protein